MTKIIALSFALWLTSADAFAQEFNFLGGASAAEAAFAFEHQFENGSGAGKPSLQEQKAQVSVPIIKYGNDSTVSLSLKGQNTELSEPVVFTNRGISSPRRFGSAEIGASWSEKKESGNRRGLSVSFGSAGRRLLDNGQTAIISGTATMERFTGEGRSWIYFLNYSNNRAILNHVPFPGFAYSIKRENSRIMVGLPFLFGMWRKDRLTSVSILSPLAASSDLSYRAVGPLLLYANAGWLPRAYQNLVDGGEDRFIVEKKEAGVGARLYLSRQTFFSAGYTYNFDRRFMLGESLSDKNAESVDLADSSGFQIKVRIGF